MRRLRPRGSRLLLVLAAALGVITTIALRDHLARLEARAAAPGPGRPIVVAAVDVRRGETLVPGMVTMREIPESYAPPGTIGSTADALGRIASADLLAGEPVTLTRLAPPGGPVASLVPPGLRAVAVTVAAPPGALSTGDRVDLLATFATGRPHTETVVEGAEVLLVRETSALEQGTASTLVLLVDPDTAERIAFARAFADLSVAIAPSPSGEAP